MKDPNEIPRRGSFLNWDGLKSGVRLIGWQIEELMPLFEGLATGQAYCEFQIVCTRCGTGVTQFGTDPEDIRKEWWENEDWMCFGTNCEADVSLPEQVRMEMRVRVLDAEGE